MRTPENETEGAGTEGAETSSNPLADGFGGDAGSDDAFGSGWPAEDDSGSGGSGGTEESSGTFDETSFLQQQGEASETESSELSAFEFEPDYVPDTDTDWDLTGDGVVDSHDMHEAASGLHDFSVDPDDSHGHAQNEGFFHSE
jgi:hypothetical protein